MHFSRFSKLRRATPSERANARTRAARTHKPRPPIGCANRLLSLCSIGSSKENQKKRQVKINKKIASPAKWDNLGNLAQSSVASFTETKTAEKKSQVAARQQRADERGLPGIPARFSSLGYFLRSAVRGSTTRAPRCTSAPFGRADVIIAQTTKKHAAPLEAAAVPRTARHLPCCVASEIASGAQRWSAPAHCRPR